MITSTHRFMKILYVITKSNYGGAQRYVHELAREMHTRGHDVAVATGGQGELISYLEEDGIRVIHIDTLQRDVRIAKEFATFTTLRNLFRDERPDIVHLNSSKAGGLGALAARFSKVPKIIFTAHGWPFLEPRPFYWRTFAFLGSYATALLSHRVILVSNNDLAHTHMPFTSSKLSVIHTAVPEFPLLARTEARSLSIPDSLMAAHKDDLWLVSLAELNHNKNLSLALQAVADINRRSSQKIFYTVFGSGDLEETLQHEVQALGASDFVHFAGTFPDVRECLAAFDALILPSKKEGLPYALLEAGRAKVPVIASNVGGIPEVITHGKNGLLIDPNDVASVIVSLEYLLENPKLKERYGNALAETVHTRFSLPNMIARTVSLYAT